MNDTNKNVIADDELDNVAGGRADGKFEEINGVVIEVLPNCGFKVQLDNGETVVAYTSGRLRMNFIRILVGDRVTVDRLAADGSNPRVVYRFKK